jgi:hypothetical protein
LTTGALRQFEKSNYLAQVVVLKVADLGQPFAGLMQISSEQLRNALAPLE